MAKTNRYFNAYSREHAKAKDLLGQALQIDMEAVLDYPEHFSKEQRDPSPPFGTTGSPISTMDLPISEIQRRYDQLNMETPVSGDDLGKMSGSVDGEETTFRLTPYNRDESDERYEMPGSHGVFRDYSLPEEKTGWGVVRKVQAPHDRANDPQRIMKTLAEMTSDSNALASKLGIADEDDSRDPAPVISLDEYRDKKDGN